MSFLGIGAPEAILVGIVALVVFGPKGLAEVSRGYLEGLDRMRESHGELPSDALHIYIGSRIRTVLSVFLHAEKHTLILPAPPQAAKSVGSTLRSFQPTIKEVVSVGQDLKSTLDKELGLDDLREAARPLPRVPGECLNQGHRRAQRRN